ncbi:hypothetical protein ACSBR1_022426 [Camellia fascicularis]
MKLTPPQHQAHLQWKNQTDFNTYSSFVIDLEGSYNYRDGLAFFFDNSDSFEPIEGGAMGLPIKPGTIKSFSYFVVVEFDTYYVHGIHHDSIPGPHVGININSLQSTTIEIWNCDITRGIEYEAWISYNSSSKNLSVIFNGFPNNSISALNLLNMNLSMYFSEWVTIGLSAATGYSIEKHTIKSWKFNSTLQIPAKKNKQEGTGSGIDYWLNCFGWWVGTAWLYLVEENNSTIRR